MADVQDEVITEEFQTGGGAVPVYGDTVSTESDQTQEFSFGQTGIEEPLEETIDSPQESIVGADSEISSPSEYVAPIFPAPAQEDSVSLDHLRAVSSSFDSGCQTFSAIVTATGLSSAIVNSCLKWLKDNGLLATSNKLYCSLDNVGVLQSQLKACAKCYGKV
jgi:hypothetical protein